MITFENPLTKTWSTGSTELDSFLQGGYERDVITTLFGPGGSGKTNLTLLALSHTLKQGKRVIYIDTEGSLSVARLEQIYPEFNQVAERLLFLKPTSFEEQKLAFSQMDKALRDHKDIGIIIIDSIAMLYRLEIGKNQDVYTINKDLGNQLGVLTQIARQQQVPVLITNQVYADFDNKNAVKMVGGDLLRYSSKCLIELRKASGAVRVARIIKHRSMPESAEFAFRITNDGIERIDIPDQQDVSDTI